MTRRLRTLTALLILVIAHFNITPRLTLEYERDIRVMAAHRGRKTMVKEADTTGHQGDYAGVSYDDEQYACRAE